MATNRQERETREVLTDLKVTVITMMIVAETMIDDHRTESQILIIIIRRTIITIKIPLITTTMITGIIIKEIIIQLNPLGGMLPAHPPIIITQVIQEIRRGITLTMATETDRRLERENDIPRGHQTEIEQQPPEMPTGPHLKNR